MLSPRERSQPITSVSRANRTLTRAICCGAMRLATRCGGLRPPWPMGCFTSAPWTVTFTPSVSPVTTKRNEMRIPNDST